MAIGISPCPPFVKRPGIPGVIYDGNTAAWFDTSSPQHVVKDGANRVSYLFDKIGYGIGAEMVNQATWYTAAYWDLAFDANWSQVGNTLVSNGNNGITWKNNFWVVGATYKITISVILAGGTLRAPFDGITVPLLIAASGTYTYYFTTAAIAIQMQSFVFNGSVTSLSIKQVTGNHLIQATGASQMLWSANGVLADGVNDFMKCTAFAYVQPEFIYFVGRQITWTINDYIFDGDNDNLGCVYQDNATPTIRPYANLPGAAGDNLVLNTFGIVRTLFNNANSSFQINNNAIILSNWGWNNMNGFTLGKPGNIALQYSNIEVKEILLRRTADNAAVQTSIYNYLSNKYAI
jgi:hypothetical protein